MVKWFDKSTQRYMESISKEYDLEIGMSYRVYYENMTPEDAVVDIVQQHNGIITVKETIDAWNRVVAKNIKHVSTKIVLFWLFILNAIYEIFKVI